MRQTFNTGFAAWLIHRISGLLLVLYIFLHLYVLSRLSDPQKFASIIKAMDNPLVKAGEAMLLLLVIVHSLNGVRLTLLDAGIATKHQRSLFRIAVVAGGLIFLFGLSSITGGVH